MGGVMLSPFIVVFIYFLIESLPSEIPPDDLLFESGGVSVSQRAVYLLQWPVTHQNSLAELGPELGLRSIRYEPPPDR